MEAPAHYNGAYPHWAQPLTETADQCAECRPLKTSPGSSSSSSQTTLEGAETPQCTDKCIVVACDQPDHLDLDDIFGLCAAGQCEQACDVAHEPIEWPCPEPNCQMKEMLRCCLDEIPSSLPVQQCHEAHVPNWPWEHCDAGPASISHCQPHCNVSIDNRRITQPSFDEMSTIRCMWGSCSRTFATQMDLLSHVHLEHLHAFLNGGHHFQQFPSTAIPLHGYQDDATQKAFSCLWDDCGLEVPPHTQNTGYFPDCDADSLLNHLLMNHIGVQGPLALEEPTNPSFTPHNSDPGTSAGDTTSVSSQEAGESTGLLCEWRNCNACFSSCDDLNNHIAEAHIGHGRSSYECLWKGCDRHGGNAFPSKQKVMRHMQKHSGFKPHICSVCQEKFAEATSLQQHMRRHTQEKPYVCDFPGCGKAFSIPGGLRIHKRAHSGEKPFKCPEAGCGRAFSESSNLAKHMRIHTGLKPFHCTHAGCGRRFGRKDQLLRHAGLHRASTQEAGRN